MLGFEKVFQAEGMTSTKAKAGVSRVGGGARDTKGHIG